MGELRQYHASLKVSQVKPYHRLSLKELPKDDLLHVVIGDTLICVQLYWESH